MPDTRVFGAGNAPVPVEDLVTVDGTTIAGDGTTRAPLRVIGGGSGGSSSAFVYTANGTEGQVFTVNLPSPRADTNYVAMAFDVGSSGGLTTFRTPKSLYTTTSLEIVIGRPPLAGDLIGILIQELP